MGANEMVNTNSYTGETPKSVINAVEGKQDKLTAGENITIDENNVISATSGGGDTPLLIEVQADEEDSFDLTAEQIEQLAKAKSEGKGATLLVDIEIEEATGTSTVAYNVVYGGVVDVVIEGETIKNYTVGLMRIDYGTSGGQNYMTPYFMVFTTYNGEVEKTEGGCVHEKAILTALGYEKQNVTISNYDYEIIGKKIVPHLYYGIVEDDDNKTLYLAGTPTTEATIQNDEALNSTGTTDLGWYEQGQELTNVVIQNSIKPTSTKYWFSGLSQCDSIDGLDQIDTSNVTNMSSMFYASEGLTSLDLSSFNTSSVTDMLDMFSGCVNLETLDVSNFDTSSVTDMRNMFNYCRALTSLDLSSFNTSSVTDMFTMFENCNALTTIYASDLFDTTNVEFSNKMFRECGALVGGNGTTYDSYKADKEYARIDTVETPGYFTAK